MEITEMDIQKVKIKTRLKRQINKRIYEYKRNSNRNYRRKQFIWYVHIQRSRDKRLTNIYIKTERQENQKECAIRNKKINKQAIISS